MTALTDHVMVMLTLLTATEDSFCPYWKPVISLPDVIRIITGFAADIVSGQQQTKGDQYRGKILGDSL